MILHPTDAHYQHGGNMTMKKKVYGYWLLASAAACNRLSYEDSKQLNAIMSKTNDR